MEKGGWRIAVAVRSKAGAGGKGRPKFAPRGPSGETPPLCVRKRRGQKEEADGRGKREDGSEKTEERGERREEGREKREQRGDERARERERERQRDRE